jgi:predicted alpha/beta-fold hydrolase
LPLLKSDYRPRGIFRHAHAGTIIPSLLRRVPAFSYVRERMTLADGDFVDLDWSRTGARRVAILCHGLEGSSKRPYVRGMVRALNQAGWDAVAYNFRGCGGEPNRTARAYHSGATDDLAEVVAHVGAAGYDKMALVGFSLGGNLVLRYLGEDPTVVPREMVAGAALSVPVDLDDACRRICSPGNRLYHDRFLRKLKKKVRAKAAVHPGLADVALLAGIGDLRDFDDVYTAPLHGFRDAEDYYRRCSCGPVLGSIGVPALLLTSRDDPMLGDRCYPEDPARASAHFHLEMADHGGHVGFFAPGGVYYSEARVVRFLGEQG